MPASLPGDTAANNLANPSAGRFVTFDPLSGPKGSPLDVRKITSWTSTPTYMPVYANDAANQTPSTGGLSTGIGVSALNAMGTIVGFKDDYAPGVTKPDGTAATNSTLMYIGGGKSAIVAGTGPNGNGAPASWKIDAPAPYTAGTVILGAGNGGSRDAGAGPAFTGFPLKIVTATATVANGAAIETGFVNRSGGSLVSGQSAFGSGTTASAAVA